MQEKTVVTPWQYFFGGGSFGIGHGATGSL
jgi:hypothetical protein